MKKFTRFFLLLLTFSFSATAQSAISNSEVKNALLQKYMINYNDKVQLAQLKGETLKHGGQSVEALIEVMKNGKYPDKNRWMATFLLGQIMGDKSAPFLVKFLKHPHWVMRMASLKTMLALKQTNYSRQYATLLNDDSFIVRSQALDNIRTLKTADVAPQVWAMLYDKKNYYQPTMNGKALKSKRSGIIKNVILTIGDLKFEKAKDPLIKMIQKDRYNDIFVEIDKSLTKITGQNSPNGDMKKKRIFWQRMALNSTIF
ncbi:MAG: HEAT repeat domain-containing protein [Bdellovibrionales bacterium]|nr:HEAT repeat domain-containing protein [Bdellovibrionales bacterium]